jgi:hypothetical protein
MFVIAKCPLDVESIRKKMEKKIHRNPLGIPYNVGYTVYEECSI